MTTYPFLIGYYLILCIFVIFNIFALRYIYRLKYLGPGVVISVLIFYLILVSLIMIATQIFIFLTDWNQILFNF